MNEKQFHIAVLAVGVVFTALFCFWVVPALIEDPDIIGGFAAGFVNPFSSGYSADVISCWVILAIWVAYEARSLGVKHGWWCVAVGVVPGVALGFAAYLVVRSGQVGERKQPS
jgi:hypothetical protein